MGAVNHAASQRAVSLAQLQTQEWDLVVIGGGITGAGVAQQAARRGWKVLLVEQRDFAWGTSSRSSKLVHGGLRYLKEGDIQTTLHSVRERERLMREAPELVQPLSFIYADCQGRKPGRWLMQTGLVVYDLMAGQRGHFYANLERTRALAPGLNPPQLRGALVFNDAKTDDARLVQRVLMEAQKDGATTLNYVAAQRLTLHDGQVCGLEVQDALSGQSYAVRARAVVNATGAWADRLRADLGAKPLLRPLRGSHLLVPHARLPVQHSISMVHVRDGRPVFLYPWEGCTLIGTTDLDHQGDLNVEASITPIEVDYLIEAVNDQFPQAHIGRADVISTYAGVRPVVDDGKGEASKATRDHVVKDESGLITLTGGKLTTFRLMAQDALALAAPRVGKPFARDQAAMFTPSTGRAEWAGSVRHRLAARFGYRAAELAAQAQASDLQTIAGTQTLWIELAIAARHEAVVHLDDLLLRRTRLGLLLPRGGLDLIARIRELCEPYLQWGDDGWSAELQRYRALVAAHYTLPGDGARF
ncbi:MAG: FAD-dependent oxidoreductase [Burkholderiales bacterium RIFCSPLOWO2_12_FULL_61_40]|nr:MAG: FAD-dependent oxidoreductase [Burkholderiales bacterium RIFCSPLOWO2_12_FULL_61_40]